MDDDYETEYPDFDYDPYDEPIGSCDECGTNLYANEPGESVEYCDQCLWRMQGGQ